MKQTSVIGLLLSFIGIILLGIIILGITFYGIDKHGTSTSNISQVVQPGQFLAGSANATVNLSTSGSYTKGSNGSVNININTNGNAVDVAKVVVTYDPSKLAVNSVTPGSLFPANNADSATAGTVKLTFNTGSDPTKTYNGSGVLASLSIKPLVAGSVTMTVDCAGSYIQAETVDLLSCSNNSVNLTVADNGSVANPTPTPTSAPATGGTSSSSGGQPPAISNAPTCGSEAPDTPGWLTAATTSYPGQVKLTWTRALRTVTHYTVTYGLADKNFQWGNPDIGNTDQFLVNGLAPGGTYKFVITANNSCASSGYSNVAVSKASRAFQAPPAATKGGVGGFGAVKAQPVVTAKPIARVTPVPTAVPTAVAATTEPVATSVATKSAVPTNAPYVYTPPNEKNNWLMSNLGIILPVGSVIVIVLLGILLILLIKYIRQQDGAIGE